MHPGKKNSTGILILIPLVFSAQTLLSQAFTQYNFNAQQGGALRYKIDPAQEKIEGSPFYNDDWREATIYNKNRTYTVIAQLRYNTCLDELIFIRNGVQYIIPDKEQIARVKLGEEEFKGAFDGKEYSFYKVLVPGESLMLLEKSDCRVMKGQPSKGYIAATPDKYYTKESIYILKPDNNAVEINPKKGKELLAYIPDQRNEMEFYIKSTKLKMKTLKDLTDVVKYYNAIRDSDAE